MRSAPFTHLKETNVFKSLLAACALVFCVNVAMWGAIIWAAVHLITKFW